MLVLDIKTIADKKGMTVRQIADKAGITYTTALAMYRGVTTRVDLETMDKVSQALGVDARDLLVKRELQAA